MRIQRGEDIAPEERRQISVWTKQLPIVLIDLGVMDRTTPDEAPPSFIDDT
jgi:hypothetical protein